MLTTGERRKQRGAERKEAAIRLPLQMIKKVAPHAVNKQIGLRKAGVSPRQGLPLRRVPGTKGARVQHVPAPPQQGKVGTASILKETLKRMVVYPPIA